MARKVIAALQGFDAPSGKEARASALHFAAADFMTQLAMIKSDHRAGFKPAALYTCALGALIAASCNVRVRDGRVVAFFLTVQMHVVQLFWYDNKSGRLVGWCI